LFTLRYNSQLGLADLVWPCIFLPDADLGKSS